MSHTCLKKALKSLWGLFKGMLEGWGDVSVSKVFTIQAWGPESELWHLCKKPVPPREVCRLGIHFWDEPLSFLSWSIDSSILTSLPVPLTLSFPVSLVFLCQSSESFERLGMSYPFELSVSCWERENFFFFLARVLTGCPYRVSLMVILICLQVRCFL